MFIGTVTFTRRGERWVVTRASAFAVLRPITHHIVRRKGMLAVSGRFIKKPKAGYSLAPHKMMVFNTKAYNA